jgi:hypothetical protein
MLSSPQSTTQTNTVIGNITNHAVLEKDIVLQGKYLFDSFELTYQLDF